jgi:predicted RNA-binding Zn ribbon-like protein
MLQFQKPDDPVALAVALANTWDTLASPPELLLDLDALARFLAANDVDRADPSERDLRAVRAVRDAVRAAFEASDESQAVDALNGLLSSTGAIPQLERAGDGWAFRYRTRTASVADVIAARAATALLEAIRVDGWSRFGVCDALPCCCVFVDRSKNRSRRYCCQLCADRVAQAAFRRRNRARSELRAGIRGGRAEGRAG